MMQTPNLLIKDGTMAAGVPATGWIMILGITVCALLLLLNVDALLSGARIQSMKRADGLASKSFPPLDPRAARVARLVVLGVRAPDANDVQALDAMLTSACHSTITHNILPHGCTAVSCEKELDAAAVGTVDVGSGKRLTGLCVGAGVRARHTWYVSVARDASSDRLLGDIRSSGGNLIMVVGSAIYVPILGSFTTDEYTLRLLPLPVRAVCFSQLMAYDAVNLPLVPRTGGALTVLWWGGDLSTAD